MTGLRRDQKTVEVGRGSQRLLMLVLQNLKKIQIHQELVHDWIQGKVPTGRVPALQRHPPRHQRWQQERIQSLLLLLLQRTRLKKSQSLPMSVQMQSQTVLLVMVPDWIQTGLLGREPAFQTEKVLVRHQSLPLTSQSLKVLELELRTPRIRSQVLPLALQSLQSPMEQGRATALQIHQNHPMKRVPQRGLGPVIQRLVQSCWPDRTLLAMRQKAC